MENNIKNEFKNSIKRVEKHMEDINLLFENTKLEKTKENIFIFGFLISLFWKEKRNIKNILPIINSIFVNNNWSFEYNKRILLKRCNDLYERNKLKTYVEAKDNLYILYLNGEYIFSSHTYQDWGIYLKNENFNYNETLLQILLDIINLFSDIKYIKEIIDWNDTFLNKYNEIRKIWILKIFRTIFLFDFLKNLFYLNYFLDSYEITLSLKIDDYILYEEYNLFWKKINYYLLSTYDTYAYENLKDYNLNQVFFEYKHNNNIIIEKNKFIFYLEDSLCRLWKRIKK